jgi:hypothetical protein
MFEACFVLVLGLVVPYFGPVVEQLREIVPFRFHHTMAKMLSWQAIGRRHRLTIRSGKNKRKAGWLCGMLSDTIGLHNVSTGNRK